ncbi:nuclease-related domain-containing protein [Ramlibacter sp.]|uniref:nuclease-related domain-containing protein n=1 Tax=Ramlibacter sp. TaxID=1917967 RepID=UPI002611612D|nr:nuclease-related domain-containing protein [Ramlibacter sp.]MDB5958054.1 Nuclease-related protein [Ramlibacter sp.]
MAEKTRSPLKDKPLRLPGQSVQREREDLIENAVTQPFMLAIFVVVLAALEWWRFYTGAKPNPVVYTVAALVMVGYAGIRLCRALPKLRSLRQGLEGERAVGQFLERLREQGFNVYHDVVGNGFNVDHVLIGPAGVFTVETKTWSKPITGRAEVIFDGEKITIGASTPDRDPVIQAKAQASWLRSLLVDSTGKQFSVRPTILFPGWFISNTDGSFREVWVLEPKALPAFLANEPTRLSREDINLASFHLSRFVRSSEKLGAS